MLLSHISLTVTLLRHTTFFLSLSSRYLALYHQRIIHARKLPNANGRQCGWWMMEGIDQKHVKDMFLAVSKTFFCFWLHSYFFRYTMLATYQKKRKVRWMRGERYGGGRGDRHKKRLKNINNVSEFFFISYFLFLETQLTRKTSTSLLWQP